MEKEAGPQRTNVPPRPLSQLWVELAVGLMTPCNLGLDGITESVCTLGEARSGCLIHGRFLSVLISDLFLDHSRFSHISM